MRKLLFAILLCFLPVVASAQVTQGNNATAHVITNDVSPTNLTTLTVNACASRFLVAEVAVHHTGTLGSATVTWDATGTPQSMTQMGTTAANGTEYSMQFGLVAPTTGNLTLRIVWGGVAPPEVYLNATVFCGVNQSGGASSFTASTPTTGTSASAAITVTSATNNMTVATCTAPQNISSYNSQTSLMQGDNGVATGAYAGRLSGSASNTHTFTLAGSVAWACSGANLIAAGAGGVTTSKSMLLGIGG